jgi:hypothetical protein
MVAVRQQCVERGAETDLIFVSFFTTLIEIWSGHFTDAAVIADETAERAQQLGGDHLRVVAMTLRAAIAAYTGRARDTREAAHTALEIAKRCGSHRLADWSLISLGFLEVSLGNYAEVLTVLQRQQRRTQTLVRLRRRLATPTGFTRAPQRFSARLELVHTTRHGHRARPGRTRHRLDSAVAERPRFGAHHQPPLPLVQMR